MRRRGSGYSSYRGRRTLTEILKLLAAVLGVLVLLLLAALWLLGKERDVRNSRPDESVQAASSQPDTTQPDASQSQALPPDDAQEEPAQAEVMRALELPVSSVVDGTAAALLEQADANALVLTMKDQEGNLAWNTQQSLAASLNLGAAEEINPSLAAWNQGEVYTAALVCCFRDNTVPYHRNSMALRAGYGNWRDELGLRWLSPASEEARSYLVQLCGELAELGFDEIVLECAAFPTAGSVDLLLTQGVDRESAVTDFLDQARAAVESHGAVLSLRLESGALTGDSGLTAAQLEQGRIWMEGAAEQGEAAALLAQKGVAAEADRLVELVPAFAETDGAQALLS